MAVTDLTEDLVSEEQFNVVYQLIRAELLEGKSVDEEKSTIILGGQPGAGKSCFYHKRDDLSNFIAINGDEYRRFHPNYNNIIKADPAHYAERTQSFSNRVVETLISDLSDKGYNLIIEGTLRNPDVPIRTCEHLKTKGYEPELVVVTCDAEKAWRSTISRAEFLKSKGAAPRLVPIEIYNTTVNQLPNSLERIEQENCFKDVTIINREGDVLYKTGQDEKAFDIMRRELDVDNWNQKYPEHVKTFEKEKDIILQPSVKKDVDIDINER